MNVKASEPFSKSSFENTKQGSNTTHVFANTASLDMEDTQIHENDCFQLYFTIFLKKGKKKAKKKEGKKEKKEKERKRKSISQSILQVVGVFYPTYILLQITDPK